ncbi:MAG: hypothetical protein ACOCUI_03765, partial [bacterium]
MLKNRIDQEIIDIRMKKTFDRRQIAKLVLQYQKLKYDMHWEYDPTIGQYYCYKDGYWKVDDTQKG